MKIAFIGLGNMGSGMCENLIRSGYEVSAFDLSKDAVKAMEALGAKAAASPADAGEDASAIITMLPAGAHVRSVLFDTEGGALKSAPSNALLIDCSTIAIDDARSIANDTHQAGFTMVDAPVSGGVAAAKAGTLTFMVGGTEHGFDQAKPILEAMGKTIVHAGTAGAGQVAKIANNMLLGISMIATSEAFHLAEKLGLDSQSFFDIASKASGQNWSMTSYCPVPGPVPSAPSNKDYAPGFAVDMMLKDLKLASEAASSCDATTEFGDMARNVYERLSDAGLGARDFSVIAKTLSES